MSLQNITAIYSGKDGERSLLSYADKLSADIKAQSKCLYIMPEVDAVVRNAFAGATTMVLYDKYQDSVQKELKEKSLRAEKEFKSIGCQNLKWQMETGDPKEITTYFGKFSDLLMLNKNIENDTDYLDVISSAIFATGGPVLIYPDSCEYRGIKNVVIGWDGSSRAAKSVKSAMDILKKAESVIVLTVDESKKDISSVKDLIEYLGLHGVKACHKNISKIGRCVGDEIVNEAKKQNADMIIMGAYTHNKLQQMVFGGATKFILGNTEVPVFMEH